MIQLVRIIDMFLTNCLIAMKRLTPIYLWNRIGASLLCRLRYSTTANCMQGHRNPATSQGGERWKIDECLIKCLITRSIKFRKFGFIEIQSYNVNCETSNIMQYWLFHLIVKIWTVLVIGFTQGLYGQPKTCEGCIHLLAPSMITILGRQQARRKTTRQGWYDFQAPSLLPLAPSMLPSNNTWSSANYAALGPISCFCSPVQMLLNKNQKTR